MAAGATVTYRNIYNLSDGFLAECIATAAKKKITTMTEDNSLIKDPANAPPSADIAKEHRYKAFISYSQEEDKKFALSLQRALQNIAKPWYRLRNFRIFRDATSLSANEDLWGAIESALRSSEYFIILASPAAVESKWVSKEIECWLDEHDPSKLIIAQTQGKIEWNDDLNDFDWNKTNAIPPVLAKRFNSEPLFIDFCKFKEDDFSLRHPDFMDRVASIAARLHDKNKEDINSEEVNQYKKAIRISVSAIVILIALSVIATNFGISASQRLSDFERMSDAKRLENINKATEMFPLTLKEMKSWKQEALDLIATKPQHDEYIADLRRKSIKRLVDGTYQFQKIEDQWMNDSLVDLSKGLTKLQDEALLNVQATLDEQDRYLEAWQVAINAISNSERYGGLVLREQYGLAPIGLNNSVLWEFAVLGTGDVPAKSSNYDLHTEMERMERQAIVLVLIPGGEFMMGSPKGIGRRDERPQHKVTMPAFFLSKYELTQSQWVSLGGNSEDAFYSSEVDSAVRPVEKIPKRMGHLMVRKGLRYPSEAEWEYACRAGTTGPYCFDGTEAALNEYAWFMDNANNQTHPVGQKKPNGWGLFDMHGNVAEFTDDNYHVNYKGAPTDGSAWIETTMGQNPVSRGGNISSKAKDVRAGKRDYDHMEPLLMGTGMRPARSIN